MCREAKALELPGDITSMLVMVRTTDRLYQVLLGLLAPLAFGPGAEAATIDDLTWDTSGDTVIITDCDTAATGELVIPDIIDGKPVGSIRQYAFEDCNSLTSVLIPDSVTWIGWGVFQRCFSLECVMIPEGITTIEGSTFANCSSLVCLTIPGTVTSVGVTAFAFCGGLKKVVFEGDAPSIGENIFLASNSGVLVFVHSGSQGFGETLSGAPVVVIGDIFSRHLYYGGSSFDELSDSDAIAGDKPPLLPGQQATFANYSSYSKGINGLMIDIASLPNPAGITTDDFVFRIGNSSDLTTWAAAPAPQSIEVEVGGGEGGSDRIKVIWANNAIQNQWLEVTVLSNADTGLIEDDLFYFGNAIGDTGNDPDSATVNISDENGTRQNPRNFLDPAPIDDPYDFNRDGFVNISDENIARQNGTNFLTELVMLDLTEATGASASRAGVGRSAGGYAPSDRVRIRRTGHQGEFVIGATLPVGRQFELQFRSEADGGEWAVVDAEAVVGGDGVWAWSVEASGARGLYRIVPAVAEGR